MAKLDRRVARTRSALVAAFNHLMLVRRQRHIKVDDIVAEADVGRSTFYEHFASADALMLQAMRTPMAPLADAAAGAGDLARVTWVLEHFWENRQRARELLGRMDAQVVRVLAEMVAERLEARGAALTIPLPIAARQLADAALGPVRSWLMAEAPCTPAVLAEAICRAGTALTSALQPAE
ncbi:TetR family transcriptional regulator [Sphingomonas sp.]|uniref:TetR/AcrR family transcriptional regulator n=1 Tax=Sphingomonas sp. TaxID=28214 RepID=UPI001B23A9B8|nr:TetR family transcriptional regulator [Sphingomonas sp.]MBO9714983.1 TetR family transcriptional regulator [Sphingomonas sp.]